MRCSHLEETLPGENIGREMMTTFPWAGKAFYRTVPKLIINQTNKSIMLKVERNIRNKWIASWCNSWRWQDVRAWPHKVIETKLCSFSQEISSNGQQQYTQCPNSPASNTHKIIEMLQIVMSSTATSRAPPGGSSAGLDSPGSTSGTPGEKTNQSRSSTEQGTISEQQEAEGSFGQRNVWVSARSGHGETWQPAGGMFAECLGRVRIRAANAMQASSWWKGLLVA